MKCKYMKPKINKGIWCTRDNVKCTNCDNKEYETGQNKKSPVKSGNLTNWRSKSPLRQKSKKLAKLEKNRFSILTNDLEHCIICGVKRDNLHEIFFGTGNRVNSMKYGCVIPLCLLHHTEMHKNKEWQDYWHIVVQKKFMDYYNMSKDDFRNIFGRNYID